MTKTYRILRKKLKELESYLESVLALPPEELAAECQLHHFLDMAQRLSFLEKMLSAEKASSPSKPKHLEHMSRRLKELGKILSEWVDSLGLTSSGMDCEHVRDDHEDVGSTCSCTESCLNDDGDATADDGVDGLSSPQRYQDLEGCYEEKEEEYKELPVVLFGRENRSQVIVEEKEETDGGVVAKLVDVKRSSSSASEGERKSGGSNGGVGVRMMCGAVVIGWLLGMVSAVVAGLSPGGFLFQCGSQQYGNFLTPT
ncbi:hypothetical protein D8674_001434 [Pyrus ussuriensis x Pyrus communis]|uniref:DUF7610 domain-containing protein n=1 Tax=Pyrus ussuriensis x Pyrus communis TaxID=2448454 RepID=A0A5N5FJK7_9ROSA|nr:hypothetical protein D8674_001434 [Pyrus ussuriensis x Pyrus communis]